MKRDWLLNQLPMGMLDDDFLLRFVSLFQDVATTVFDQIDTLEHQLDPAVAPPTMLRELGRWLGEDRIDETLPVPLQRRLVMEAGKLLSWRGTARGLSTLLEVLTDRPVEVLDDGGVYREDQVADGVGHVVVRVQTTGLTSEEHLVELVRHELPATVTFELYVGERQLWPRMEPLSLAVLES